MSLVSPAVTKRAAFDVTPLLAAHRISKRFGSNVAIDAVSFALVPGEIHALLGENGAGKSTLLAILSGMDQPDSGVILAEGHPIRFPGPAAALRERVATVYQHAALVPTLSIAENVALGGGGIGLSLSEADVRVTPHLRLLGVAREARTMVADLAPGERQRVEIARALARGSRILLLDEPTAVLAPPEVGRLLETLRELRSRGVAIALVTHKLEEALAVADRLTILRGGRVAATMGPDDLATADPYALRRRIVSHMFGDASVPRSEAPSERPSPDSAVLSLRHLRAFDDRQLVALPDLSLDLHAGEIVGIAGVEGNGQKELAEVIAGQRAVAAGQVRMHGRDLANRGVEAALRAGVAYLTDDRFGEGCVAAASVADNVALKRTGGPPFATGFRLDRGAVRRTAESVIDRFRIQPRNPRIPIGTLSGGTIQKVLLGREMLFDPVVLVCKEPTQGLDLRTTAVVREALRRRAAAGGTVLLISSDLDELLDLGDRLGVLYRGRLAGPYPRGAVDRAALGRIMVGGGPDEPDR